MSAEVILIIMILLKVAVVVNIMLIYYRFKEFYILILNEEQIWCACGYGLRPDGGSTLTTHSRSVR